MTDAHKHIWARAFIGPRQLDPERPYICRACGERSGYINEGDTVYGSIDVGERVPWFATYDNIVALARFLVHERDFSTDLLLEFIEKPYNWGDQWIEYRQWLDLRAEEACPNCDGSGKEERGDGTVIGLCGTCGGSGNLHEFIGRDGSRVPNESPGRDEEVPF